MYILGYNNICSFPFRQDNLNSQFIVTKHVSVWSLVRFILLAWMAMLDFHGHIGVLKVHV